MGKATSLTTPGQVRTLAEGSDGCSQCPDCGGKLELYFVRTIGGEQFDECFCPQCWYAAEVTADYGAASNAVSDSQFAEETIDLHAAQAEILARMAAEGRR